MNIYTKKDIKDIESRLNVMTCPFCEGQSTITLSEKNNLLHHRFEVLCCEKMQENFLQFLNTESSKQQQIRINQILDI